MIKSVFFKTIFCIACLAAFLSVFTVAPYAQDQTAQVIESYNLTADTANFSSLAITDHNRSTKIKIPENLSINFEGSDKIFALYLVWDYPPESWHIIAENDEEIIKTNNGFLHEYIKLDAPITNFKLEIQNAVLCDVYLLSEGTPPDFVQQWQPPYNDADILLVPTHADDEHLFFGGTMPFYSASKKVQVAYLTNHWGEPYRPHELLDGLWAVGITVYPIISDFRDAYADSLDTAKKIYNETDILDFQVELLRRFKPEVVIGHDVNGEYGHGAHILNSACLQTAVLQASDNSRFEASAQKYGVWDVPKTYLHLYTEGEIIMNWDTPLPQFDGKTALEMAVEGFSKHKSQQEYFSVEAKGPYDCRKFGLFRSTVGEDTEKNDFFENITEEMYSDYTPPVIETPAPTPAPKPTSSPQPISKPIVPLFVWKTAALIIIAGLVCLIFILMRKNTKNK